MDNFIVSARKYRPSTFQTVVGQQHITGTLKNAIRNNQLAQAFLFCGPRGVGKTTCARILAKTINCQNLQADTEACGECDSCVSFQNGNSFNIHELDAASNNSVDDIRSLIEQVRIPPQAGKYKIYIIDEVHMLSQAAFNAFLKTLEEPPSYAIFILATTEKHKILPTILSRCQIFDFNRISVEDMAAHLQGIAVREHVNYDQDGLHLIAQKADGGLRDALSMFDQIVSFSDRNVSYRAVIDNLNILDYEYYFRLTDSILAEDAPAALLIFDEILLAGFDGNHFVSGLASHFRNLLVANDASTLKLLEVSEGIRNKYLTQAQATNASFLMSALSICNQCELNYKSSKNQRLQVELALLKLCHLPSLLSLPTEAIPAAEVKKKPEPIDTKSEPSEQFFTAGEDSDRSSVIRTTAVEEPKAERESSVPEEKYTPDHLAEVPFKKEEFRPPLVPKIELPKSATLIPNLQDLESGLRNDENKAPEFLTGDDRQTFNPSEFLEVWNDYAERAKRENKINIFTIMTANAPLVSENFIIDLTIENKIQEDLLNSEKVDLLNFLRTSLKNFAIDIRTSITEVKTKKRLYTSTEKYQHMVEKNPMLEEFRRRFNLDIEY